MAFIPNKFSLDVLTVAAQRIFNPNAHSLQLMYERFVILETKPHW